MNHVAVIVLHVLNQSAAEGNIHQLKTTADGQKRNLVFDGPFGEAQISCILQLVDAVELVALGFLPVKLGVQVAAAGHEHGRKAAQASCPIGVRCWQQGDGFSAGIPDRFNERSSTNHGSRASGGRPIGKASEDGDSWSSQGAHR